MSNLLARLKIEKQHRKINKAKSWFSGTKAKQNLRKEGRQEGKKKEVTIRISVFGDYCFFLEITN